MRVIKPGTIMEYCARHPDARSSLVRWLADAEAARGRNIDDVRRTFPHADAASVASGATVTIFNIKGNKYRLIVAIHYNRGVVFIRDFMTHAQYSKGKWKERH